LEKRLKIFMTDNIKEKILVIFLFILAFYVNFQSANKGVFPIDTFLHYDSASRILENTYPIKDFWVVHGITIDYLQSVFFFIFGNNWLAYVAHASLFNSLISISTYIFFNHLGVKKLYSCVLAISFAVLAYPISGTPFIDQHAIFFCLLAFYFFSFGIKAKLKYLFFIPFLLGLAFFSKQVPTIYFAFVLGFLFLVYAFVNKDYSILKYPLLGTITFFFLLYFFLELQNISIKSFLTQIFYYPMSIGGDRYAALNIDIKKILSNYKFILLPILISLFLIKNQYSKVFKNLRIFNFSIVILFNLISIFHQLMTKNQNFIFFLIPINLAFLILFIEDKFETNKHKNKLFFLVIIFCIFTTFKYHHRFNVERKFIDLQDVKLTNSVQAKKIHSSFYPLKWKTRNFNNPIDEIKIVSNVIKKLENEKNEIILMTNYNFISTLTNKKIYALSKTYDSISFPNKSNIYYSQFKKFFDNKIKLKKITHIYLFFTNKDELNYGLERYILEYYNLDCLKIDNLENYLIKVDLTNCVI